MQIAISTPSTFSNSLSAEWQFNKQKMLNILKNSPITGVYKNENPKYFNQFFDFYINFLNSQTGPRGECAKRIRQQLIMNRQKVDVALKPYALDHSKHIRSIYVKFKHFIPCHEYHLHQTISQTLAKYEESLARIKQPDHPMYKSISEGMIKKHGPDYPCQQEMKKIQQNYVKRIENLKADRLKLEDRLSQMDEYQNWLRMNQIMKKWFDEWAEADSGIGKDSCNRGDIFQNKTLNQVIPWIIQRQQHGVLSHVQNDSFLKFQSIQEMITQSSQSASKKHQIPSLHILLNMRWEPRSLGEIDIAIVEFCQQRQRYEALILVECKARLFDIREASYQVFPEYLKRDKKTILSGKYGPVYLSSKVTSYIVTTLPELDFLLPIQSELKASLDKITKDMPIETMSQQQTKANLFKGCLKRFQNELSPLEWFYQNDSDKIIVLSSPV